MTNQGPFDARRVPIYYGWVVMVAATVGVTATIPAQTAGISPFTEALLHALQVDRLGFSNAYLIGTLASGLLLPWVGVRIDRIGARVSAMQASVLMGTMLLLLAHVETLVGLTNGGAILWLSFLFFLLRFAGQGMLSMASRTMLGRWFSHRRGLASGISSVVVGLAFGIAPKWIAALVSSVGWRSALHILAASFSAVTMAVAYLLFRDSPESARVPLEFDTRKSMQAPVVEYTRTRSEALRTRSFWALTIALAAQALIVTGITFHIVDICARAELSVESAMTILWRSAVVGTIVAVAGGLLVDRGHLRMAMNVLLLSLMTTLHALTDLSRLADWLFLSMGVSAGLYASLSLTALPRLFGRTHLGAISGAQMMCLVSASAIGPSLFAASRVWYGDYLTIAYLLMALPALAFVLTTLSQAPEA